LAAEETAVHDYVLFIYIQSELVKVDTGVGCVYNSYSNLYKLTLFQRNNVI